MIVFYITSIFPSFPFNTKFNGVQRGAKPDFQPKSTNSFERKFGKVAANGTGGGLPKFAKTRVNQGIFIGHPYKSKQILNPGNSLMRDIEKRETIYIRSISKSRWFPFDLQLGKLLETTLGDFLYKKKEVLIMGFERRP